MHFLPMEMLCKVINDEPLDENEREFFDLWKEIGSGAEDLVKITDSLDIEEAIGKVKSLCEPFTLQQYFDTILSGDIRKVDQMTLESISYKLILGKELSAIDRKNLDNIFKSDLNEIKKFIDRNSLLNNNTNK